MGPVVAFDAASNPHLPRAIDQYIMGAYGDIRTKGKDVLGEEQPYSSSSQSAAPGSTPAAAPVDTWLMTRSEVSNDATQREGSPYGVDIYRSGPQSIEYGNPNGIRDALILILTAGEDYDGDR
jgi:hypothetical protein